MNNKNVLLKDMMNTKTEKNLATKQHKYMVEFLEKVNEEWGFPNR